MKIKMTEVQKAYLLGRNDAFSGRTGTHIYIELSFNGDIEKLNKAFNKLILKQPMLRAKVLDLEYFKIYETLDYKFKIENVLNEKDVENIKIQKRNELSHKLYKAENFPYFTVDCLSIDASQHIIFFSLDLLIADGMSIFQLFDQWRNLYEDENYPLEDMTKNLLYINHKYHEEKKSDRYKKAKNYWLGNTSTLPEAPQLMLNLKEVEKSDFKRLEYNFSNSDFLKMQEIATEKKISINTVFLTLYAAVLQRWSTNKNFTINMTTFKRPRKEEYMSVIGDFTSTTLINTDINLEDNLTENVHKLQRRVNESFRYSAFEGVEVLRELAKDNDRSSIMPFVFTSMLFDFNNFDSFGKIDYWVSETPQVYLDCQLKIINGELNISWDYIKDIFECSQINKMFSNFIESFKMYMINSEEALRAMDRKYIQESDVVYDMYNAQAIRKLENNWILCKFPSILNEKMHEIAFEDVSGKITFKELDQKSELIKEKIIQLKQKHNLDKIRIGINTNKSNRCIVEMLGVLKAGDSFCFINKSLSKGRQDKIKEICECSLIIENGTIEFILKPNNKIPKDELYVIFTSGTTGEPKGISINEDAVLNTIYDLVEKLNIDSTDVIFNISELSFDLSIFDILTPLLVGTKTILCESVEQVKNYTSLFKEITIWNSTPGLAQLLLKYSKLMTSIRCVLMSGDFIPSELVNSIQENYKNPNLVIYSLGGATEVSIWSIYYPITKKFNKTKIPYGYPLSNQTIYVLDGNYNTVENYVSGEIFIGGLGLANGYLDKENTNKAFINHNKFGRLYKTGDKGYMSDEGCIYIVGRMQAELKVNGYRIDLLEIENIFNNLNNIKQSKVYVKKTNHRSIIVTVYISEQGEELESSYIREELKKHLPSYMIPTNFVNVENIPLTANGKVDVEQLNKMIEINQPLKLNQQEENLLVLWEEIIGDNYSELNNISENFFDIGGDSIKLPELLHEICIRYQIEISIEDLLNNFSLKEQAKLINDKVKDRKNSNINIHKQLIQLKKGKTNKNIVLIHAGSGEIAIYNKLAQNLDADYNIYAIKFEKNYKDVAMRSIDLPILAGKYNEIIKELDSVDYIGGWCIGGTLGFEITKINPNIKGLLLINSMPPVNEKVVRFEQSLTAEMKMIEDSFNIKISDVNNTTELWNRIILMLENRLELMPKLVKIVPPELSRLIPHFGSNKPRELVYYINLFRSFETVRFMYSSSKKINVPIIYIGAKNEPVDDYYSWSDHTERILLEEHVNGDHTTIFDKENVIGLANSINKNLISIQTEVKDVDLCHI